MPKNNNSVLSALLQSSNVQGNSSWVVGLLQNTLENTFQNTQNTLSAAQTAAQTAQSAAENTVEAAVGTVAAVENTVETTLQNTISILSLMSIENLITQLLTKLRENGSNQ